MRTVTSENRWSRPNASVPHNSPFNHPVVSYRKMNSSNSTRNGMQNASSMLYGSHAQRTLIGTSAMLAST